MSRDFPLLEGGNGAVLLAGLSLSAGITVTEVLGGAPAVLDQIVAAPEGTLVIAADDSNGVAGAGAVLIGNSGANLTAVARQNRSLPTVVRGQDGGRHDYGDPRLQREMGVKSTVARLGLDGKTAVAAVAGVKANQLGPDVETAAAVDDPKVSAAALIWVLARAIEKGQAGLVIAVEQSSVSAAHLVPGETAVNRDEFPPLELPKFRFAEGTGIPISLAAYARAFEPKLRWEAAVFDEKPGIDGNPQFPPRDRVESSGKLADTYRLEPLPRTGTVYNAHHDSYPGSRSAESLFDCRRATRRQPGPSPDEDHRRARGRQRRRRRWVGGVAANRHAKRRPRLRLLVLARPHDRDGRSIGMRRVAMVGAGMTPFAEHFELGIKDLIPRAYAEATANVDKGIDKSEIQAAWFGELSTTDGFPSGILADTLDLTDIPVTRIENACATGNDAIRHGVMAIASGMYDVVLVVGADKVRETASNTTFWEWGAMTRDNAWDYPLGLVAPANFALHVNRYLHESPATKEHMAMVAVKNHFHAVTNPKAQLRYEITVEQALAAPMVVDPFGLYDCTPQSDGAAAVILAAEEVVDRYTDRPVWVRGVGLGMDRVMHQHKTDMTTFPPTVKAAKAAMAMAGVTPRDIDVAEVHDCFTGVELISYEDLGFAERFEAYKIVEAREHYVGGSIPINPSGGLKAKGHPPGATGVAQCYELFNQLRGEAENQVDGARVALAHNVGGPTAVSAVTILSNIKN